MTTIKITCSLAYGEAVIGIEVVKRQTKQSNVKQRVIYRRFVRYYGPPRSCQRPQMPLQLRGVVSRLNLAHLPANGCQNCYFAWCKRGLQHEKHDFVTLSTI